MTLFRTSQLTCFCSTILSCLADEVFPPSQGRPKCCERLTWLQHVERHPAPSLSS